MSSEIEAAVIQLYEARLAAKEAKAAHRRKAEEVGTCKDRDSETIACYLDPAYDVERWCEACKAKQPLWVDYHKKVNAQAVALRRVIAIGKALSRNVEGSGGTQMSP